VAHIEAFIDFSEDENIEDNVMDVVEDKLKNLKKVIKVRL
jgi:tRNA U34 5-carboxymethylaminomethyl modifying GTPase MnmE/TrmE